MTVPQEVKLARHAGDLDDDGHDTYAGSAVAADVSIVDAGGYFTATDVEAALQELAKKDIGYQAHGNLGSTETFDALTGWHSGTANANCTVTLTGATTGLVASMVLEIAVDSGGPYTFTWPGSVVWSGGSAPTLSASTTYLILLMSRDGGTTWYGFLAGGSSGPDLTGIDFLVGTASVDLTSEIVVGTTPGGELGGTWASPTVDTTHSGSSHAATQAAAEATAAAALAAHVAAGGGGDHVHVVDEQFSGDGSTTVFVLANEAVPDSVMAWVSGTRTPVTLGGTLNDEITFGSAPASATNNISVDYAAVLA